MDLTEINNLIASLRAETEKNSISPERIGFLFRMVMDAFSLHGEDQIAHIPADRNLSLNSLVADREDDGMVLSSKEFDDSSILDGHGYGLRKIGDKYHFFADYLTARKGMTVAELVIQEYKSVGGVLVLSACNGEMETAVQDGDSGSPYWMINIKDWDKHPQFLVDDIIRCSRWDDTTNDYVSYIGVVENSEAEEEGASQHIYVRIVSGNATPQVGDNLVQFGNEVDTTRQGLIIISTEDGKPNITLYDGLNSADVNLNDKMTARLGNLNGLVKDGKTLSGYGLWTNNLYLGSKAEEVFKELINIGGRNYALGTSTPFTNNISTTASDWQDMRMYFAKGLKAGDVVNVSFDWSAVGANNATINKIKLQFGYGTEPTISKYHDGEELLLSTATGTYNCQMAVPDGVTEDTTIHVRLRVFSNSVTSITVSHLMLQKGQGDWQPAPEDALNALAEYKEEISHEFEVTNQGLSSVQRSVTQLNAGSRNLLLATNQGATGWNPSNVYSVDGVKGEYTAFTREVYSSENHNEFLCFDLRPELIQNGKQYLLSFEIYLPEDYGNVDNLSMYPILASRNFTDVLSTTAYERNNLKTQIGAWVKMEYVITANASGTKDDATSIYISIARVDYNKFQYFYIRNLQLLERTADSAIAVSDDEFLPWRPALEDANNYADLVAEQAKKTAITQTKEDINIGAYAKTTYVDGKIDDAKAEIKFTTDSISQSVSNLSTSVDGQISGLESEINQTADSISLKVKELGITSLNYAYGTGAKAEITSLTNINNQSVNLYNVTGLVGGDMVSVSFKIRIKNIIFDTLNGTRTARIFPQLSAEYGYYALGITITADTFKDKDGNSITPDEDGYLNAHVSSEGIVIPATAPAQKDTVGYIYARLDYIDSEVDAEGNDIGVIEISELKIEKGDECTAWTSRTQDMEKSLQATGVDIENKRIVATADSFVIQNNLGQVTASVDENGNLATGTVLCWNTDEATKNTTPYLATLNRNGNSYLEFFYPLSTDNGNNNIAFQIGWDGKSVFRFYKPDGTQAWIAGDYTGFLKDTTSEIIRTITEEKFHYTGTNDLNTAKSYVQNTRNLSANATLYKVVTQDANGVTSYYATDKEGVNKVSSGIYTLPGTPQLGPKLNGDTGNVYRRTLYVANANMQGVFMLQVHQWDTSSSLNSDIINQ